jgi:hypothetical protein
MASTSLTGAAFQTRAHARVEPEGRFGGVGEGRVWLWRHPFFRSSALLFAAGNPLYTGLYLLAILLAKHHGASSGEVGAMFAIAGALRLRRQIGRAHALTSPRKVSVRPASTRSK